MGGSLVGKNEKRAERPVFIDVLAERGSAIPPYKTRPIGQSVVPTHQSTHQKWKRRSGRNFAGTLTPSNALARCFGLPLLSKKPTGSAVIKSSPSPNASALLGTGHAVP